MAHGPGSVWGYGICGHGYMDGPHKTLGQTMFLQVGGKSGKHLDGGPLIANANGNFLL